MTKKEIQAMSDGELIEHFVCASVEFGRHTMLRKSDLAQFDKLAEELINRNNILTQEQCANIKRFSTL